MKKSIRISVVIAVVALAGFLLKRRADERAARVDEALTLYGNVDIRQVVLGFRVGGRMDSMAFEEGDAATEGQVLAALERGPLEDNLALFEAQAGVAQAGLAKLEAGTRPGEVAQARARVEELETALANADQSLGRQLELAGTGAVSKQAADDARAQHDEAAARLRSAREALALAVEGPRAEDLAIARAELVAARAQVALAQRQLADAELKAPAKGIILARVEEPGAIVAAGAAVYTLSLQAPVWVRCYISEPNLGRIHPGMAVEVIGDSRPEHPYRGQIGFISPVAEFTPKSVETEELRADLVYRLRVVVVEPDEALRQGMPVTVRIPDAKGSEAATPDA